MPDHYFAPRIEFPPKGDPLWIANAITEWENGESIGGPRILGTDGRRLPELPALEPGLIEHRWGTFTDGSDNQYRLRIEVVDAQLRVRIGLLFAGPELPGPKTRGGGDLVQQLLANWKHPPEAATFPTRPREVTTSMGLEKFFKHLIDPRRSAPIVLVTRRSRGEDMVADPERLHEYLLGMAEVWSVPRTNFTRDLAQKFVSRGFEIQWNCYDGGIRLYLPGLDPAKDPLGRHPLVLPTRLLVHGDPTAAAASWALGAVTRVLEVDEWRARWRKEVAGPRMGHDDGATLADLGGLQRLRLLLGDAEPEGDALAPLENADEKPESKTTATPAESSGAEELRPATTEAEPTSTNADTSASAPRLAEANDEAAANVPLIPSPAKTPSDGAIRGARAQPRLSRIERGRVSLRGAFDAFADLEGLLEELEDELKGLRIKRDALALERDELSQQLQDQEQEQERAGRELGLPSSVDDVLTLFDNLGGDSFRVTVYAHRKARDSNYADVRLLWQVLSILAAVGPEFGAMHAALSSSLGRRARAKPKDSKQTMAKFGQHRRFSLDDGTVAEVEQHVTLGHGTRNSNETLQIYWRRAPNGTTEIVYAGEHLPTASENA